MSTSSSSWQPGYTDYNNLATEAGSTPRWDYPTWREAVVSGMLANLQSGDPNHNGQPAGWNPSTMGDWATIAAQIAGRETYPAGLKAKLYSLVDSPDFQQGSSGWLQSSGLGLAPSASDSDYLMTPGAQAKAADLALKQQDADLKAAQLALQYSSSGGSVRTTSSSGGSRSSGGRGGGGGSSASAVITPYQQAVLDRQAAQDAAQAARFEKDYALRVQSENSNEAYRQQTLAQQAADRAEAARQARATTIAKLSANPGDAVEREFTMRGYAQPNGTPVDVFTGQVSGPTQNLSQLMASQASLLKPYTQAALTGQPIPGANGGVDTTLPTTPNTSNSTLPGYAQGTAADPGFTKAPQFIAGDDDGPNPFGGGAKPELIQLKTAPDGQPEARIFNHRQLARMMGGTAPRYAGGTDYSNLPGYSTMSGPAATWDPQPVTDTIYSSTGQYTPDYAAGAMRQMGTGFNFDVGSSAGVPLTVQQRNDMANAAVSNYNADTNKGPGYVPYITAAQANQVLGITPPAPPKPAATTPPTETTVVKNPYDPTTGQTNIDFTKPYTVDPNSGVPLQTEKVKTPTSGQLPTSYNAHDPGNPLPNPTLPQAPPSGAIPYGNDNQAQPTTVKILNPDGTIGEVPSYVAENSPATKALADAYNKKFPQSGATNGVTPQGWVNGRSGDNASDSTQQKPPPQAGTATAKPGVAQMGAATASGYRTFTSPGSYTSKDGSIVYNNLRGDGTEVLQPDGTVARYDYKLQQYVPVTPHTTMVNTAADFYALPDSVKQAIWSGRPTSYFLNPAIVPQITNWGMTNPTPMLTQDQFNALPADQRQTLINGGQVPGVPTGQAGMGPVFSDPRPVRAMSMNDAHPGTALPSMLFQLPQGEASFTPYDYSQYAPPDNRAAEQLNAELWAQVNAAQQPTTPPPATTPPASTPPATTPPATTPPATTPPATTGGGTTLPTGTTTGGTTGTGTLPTGTANGGISTLSYGPEVWQNLPNLRVMLGQLKPADFQRLGNGDTAVPALGITIPAVNKSNYGNMLMMRQTDPDGWELLKSIYAVANRNLDAEMAAAKERAPLGSATYDTGLIDTGP